MNQNNCTITRVDSDDSTVAQFGVTEFDGRHFFVKSSPTDAAHIEAAAEAEFKSFSMNAGLIAASTIRVTSVLDAVQSISCVHADVSKDHTGTWKFSPVVRTVISSRGIIGFNQVSDGALTLLLSSGSTVSVPDDPELCRLLERMLRTPTP